MKKFFFLVALVSAFIMGSCTSNSQLELAIKVAAADCPMDLGDGLVITGIEKEGTNVLFTCVMDEVANDFTIAEMDVPEVRAVMKDAMMQTLKEDDEDLQAFVKLVKEANCNVIYRFVGSHTNEQMDIVVYPHEL